jgi:hypothetical protein
MATTTTETPAVSEAIATVCDLNDQYIKAVRTNDASWFEKHMADDALVITSSGKRMSKRDFIGAMPTDYCSLTVRHVTARAYGTTVQVDADAPFELGDGSTGISRYIDTYAWIQGRWQVISAQYIRLPVES